MAKKHKNGRKQTAKIESIAPKEAETMRQEHQIAVELPIAELTDGYIGKHINVRFSNRQATALRRITLAADRGGETLDCGRRVTDNTGGLRYILEKAADEMGIS